MYTLGKKPRYLSFHVFYFLCKSMSFHHTELLIPIEAEKEI